MSDRSDTSGLEQPDVGDFTFICFDIYTAKGGKKTEWAYDGHLAV